MVWFLLEFEPICSAVQGLVPACLSTEELIPKDKRSERPRQAIEVEFDFTIQRDVTGLWNFKCAESAFTLSGQRFRNPAIITEIKII